MNIKYKIIKMKYRLKSKLEDIARFVQNRPEVVHSTAESYFLTAKEHTFDHGFTEMDPHHKTGITDPNLALNSLLTSCSLEKYQNIGPNKNGTAYFLYDGTYIRIDNIGELKEKPIYNVEIINKDERKIMSIVNMLSQLGTLEPRRRQTSAHANIEDKLRDFKVWQYVR